MKHNFSWYSTGSTALTCRVKCRSLWISDRDDHSKTSHRHLLSGSTDTHTGPTCAKFSVKLLQFSLAETAQYVRQCSWCSMEGISLLITPATILSPFYPDLWMCPVRDSGLFTFLAQILIVPIQLLYYPSFTEHGSRIRNFTHTHTYSLSLFPISWLFSIPPVSCSLFDQSVQVLVLHMICQTLFGSKLAASLSAATYSNSRFSCAMFWSASVTKVCKQSPSSFELREVPPFQSLPLRILQGLHFQSPPSTISQSSSKWTPPPLRFPNEATMKRDAHLQILLLHVSP
jgi:hypothetical protein